MSRRTRETIQETGGVGHVVNLGHGVPPGSRLDCVEAFFAAVRGPVPVGEKPVGEKADADASAPKEAGASR